MSRKVDTLLRLVGVDSLREFNRSQILNGIEDCRASYKQKPFGKKFCGDVYELKHSVGEHTRRHDVVCPGGISGAMGHYFGSPTCGARADQWAIAFASQQDASFKMILDFN